MKKNKTIIIFIIVVLAVALAAIIYATLPQEEPSPTLDLSIPVDNTVEVELPSTNTDDGSMDVS